MFLSLYLFLHLSSLLCPSSSWPLLSVLCLLFLSPPLLSHLLLSLLACPRYFALIASHLPLLLVSRLFRCSPFSPSLPPHLARVLQTQPDPLELQRQQETQRRRAAKKRAQMAASQRPSTPQAVDGRAHMDVQTELYLEELTDRVEETDMQTQTDAFLDRPPSPLFIPPKTGVDIATQILEGELFDFDLEVKPILEVLVGKTLEQALMEVMEEEELDRLRDHQRSFEDLRNAELAEMQRLEEAARRREAEKAARMDEQRRTVAAQKETAEKIAARAFAQSYLSGLVPSVFNSLSDGGFFYDRQERGTLRCFKRRY